MIVLNYETNVYMVLYKSQQSELFTPKMLKILLKQVQYKL